jgi:hypothetical protein
MDPESPTQTGVSSLEETREAPTGCKHLRRARSYQFRRDIPDPLCLVGAVLYRPVLRCGVYVSAVVGTILTIINQGDVLLAGAVTPLVVEDLADLRSALQRLDLLRLVGEPG